MSKQQPTSRITMVFKRSSTTTMSGVFGESLRTLSKELSFKCVSFFCLCVLRFVRILCVFHSLSCQQCDRQTELEVGVCVCVCVCVCVYVCVCMCARRGAVAVEIIARLSLLLAVGLALPPAH